MSSNKYIRQTQVAGFGSKAQKMLLQAKVLVVGAGGLGVPALQYLTGMGVGTIGIIDGDTIDRTNLHRQVLYTESEIGLQKAEVAVGKLKNLNTDVQFRTYCHFLHTENALDIISLYDLVIDASDNFGTRYLINDACVILDKPFVYGAVQQQEGHISVFNYQDGPTYRCLYPASPAKGEIPDCNDAGVLGVVPGIIGCQQALQAIKILTGFGQNLSGYLQIFDFNTNDQLKIKLKANPLNKQIVRLQNNYNTPTCAVTGSITVEELFQWYTQDQPFCLVDVREPKEYAVEHLQGALSMPLSVLNERLAQLPDNVPIVTICQIGGRSAKAVQIISSAYTNKFVYNVIGGMETWFDELGDQLVIEPKPAN